jgi:energy-coupling factor transporter ATP-binding protein EcfA2
MMRLQFGWADDDEKFILGNREIGASYVKYSPPSKATRDIAHALRPVGSLDEWKEIINVYNMPGFEPHAFAVFSAFGAPLIKFMGVKGGIINLINNKSGTGKSTILQVMNSVWGHPDELMIQWRDTLNVKLHRMAVMCNLPLGVDEITKMSGDDFSDMAYSVTQGAPRRRMKASTNEERESQGFWATMMVATSNSSMTDKLESLKSTSEGELMRLMQYKIDPTNNLDKATAKHIFGRLNSNYGLAGQPYAQYLVQNLEEVVDTALKVQARFDKAVNIDTRERFWSAMAGANLTGALIASKLGLHDINHKRVFDWAVAEVSEMQTATKLSFNDYATVVGEFLLKHNLNILVINKFSTSKSGIASTPLLSPRGPLVVRHEPDTRRIYIIRHELKNFCVLKQVTFNDLLTGLNKTGAFIAEVRTRLDIGTDISAPPVVALEFDADLLGIDFNFNDKGNED